VLTVVGQGPEATALIKHADRLGIGRQVHFVGSRQGEEVVRLLNAHRILVVPSLYNEPFGIVALEGIACGCLVIGSRGGGLQAAIGDCGLTFRNGDSEELADLLEAALADPDRFLPTREKVADHLSRHASQRVSEAYLRVLEEVVREGKATAPGRRESGKGES
jgi:glycogen synthase